MRVNSLIVVLSLAIMLASCEQEPIKTTVTDNRKVSVDLLFTNDGCKVFRFIDGEYHYYVVCEKSATQATMTDFCRSTGKSCSPVHNDIPTVER